MYPFAFFVNIIHHLIIIGDFSLFVKRFGKEHEFIS